MEQLKGSRELLKAMDNLKLETTPPQDVAVHERNQKKATVENPSASMPVPPVDDNHVGDESSDHESGENNSTYFMLIDSSNMDDPKLHEMLCNLKAMPKCRLKGKIIKRPSKQEIENLCGALSVMAYLEYSGKECQLFSKDASMQQEEVNMLTEFFYELVKAQVGEPLADVQLMIIINAIEVLEFFDLKDGVDMAEEQDVISKARSLFKDIEKVCELVGQSPNPMTSVQEALQALKPFFAQGVNSQTVIDAIIKLHEARLMGGKESPSNADLELINGHDIYTFDEFLSKIGKCTGPWPQCAIVNTIDRSNVNQVGHWFIFWSNGAAVFVGRRKRRRESECSGTSGPKKKRKKWGGKGKFDQIE